MTGQITCSDCSGYGSVHYLDCAHCDGNGYNDCRDHCRQKWAGRVAAGYTERAHSNGVVERQACWQTLGGPQSLPNGRIASKDDRTQWEGYNS